MYKVQHSQSEVTVAQAARWKNGEREKSNTFIGAICSHAAIFNVQATDYYSTTSRDIKSPVCKFFFRNIDKIINNDNKSNQ